MATSSVSAAVDENAETPRVCVPLRIEIEEPSRSNPPPGIILNRTGPAPAAR
jgi:hypothetical protein